MDYLYNFSNRLVSLVQNDKMEHTQLYTKISVLPTELKSEVNDFVDFLMNKLSKRIKKKIPKFGCAKGQIHISPDFDEPLEDFKDYM
jgi:hypothetical protein